MLIKVCSATALGVSSLGIVVEVDLASRGMPYFDIVGLPNKAVAESKHRVKTALLNSGIKFPEKRITVNLAPADVPKEGSFCDLPIATGIMCGVLDISVPEDALFFGEVSLDGSVRHTKGALLLALYAKNAGFTNLFVPKDCAREAASVSGVQVYAVENLSQLVAHLSGICLIQALVSDNYSIENATYTFDCDMNQILGQEQAKRALEIAAAGGHNFMMLGPPGSGKTMLANGFCSILPPLTEREALEVTKIYSSIGYIPPGSSLITKRPFRSPHHTISYAGMVGGGSIPKPGEISLAHRGTLFMDEFPEFSRAVLEALRQPMEAGKVTISRSLGSYSFPAQFILLAASNPCPCGFRGHLKNKCVCTPNQVNQYKKKLSGPILDRIDLFSNILPVPTDELSSDKRVLARLEKSSVIRHRVINAREIQNKRFKGSSIFVNSEMKNSHISEYCALPQDVEGLLKRVVAKFNLSARAYFKLIRVARTIADLAGSGDIASVHMAEAIQYRVRPGS